MTKLKQPSPMLAIVIIFIASLVLLLPQYLSRSMIVGSDAIFHFNRFYDTSMQLTVGEFQPTISLYGFQQSGRIINALYGPVMAYFHGLLVFVSPSWFHYQLLSNLCLYLIAGCSMFVLLRTNRLKPALCLNLSLIFMTTYAIQYWVIRQGFSSWGAAFLPLALIPLKPLIEKRTIKPIQLACLVALIVETHLFSSFLLVLIYLPFFGYALFKTTAKWLFIRQLTWATCLFFLITAHLWASLWEIYRDNTILPPFINQQMAQTTINAHSYYWLINPLCLLVLIGYQFIAISRKRPDDILHKLIVGTALFFTLCATSLLPWQFMLDQKMALAELIQFPFRFFIPATVLYLWSFGLVYNRQKRAKWLSYATALSLTQALLLSFTSATQWQSANFSAFAGKHATLLADHQTVKNSFFDANKQLSLSLWQKSTPDYLPLYHETTDNYYDLYRKFVLEPPKQISTTTTGNSLILKWTNSSTRQEIDLPVVYYRGSLLYHNKERLSPDNSQLSAIGTPRILEHPGENTVELSYPKSRLSTYAISLSRFSFFVLIVFSLIKTVKKKTQTR